MRYRVWILTLMFSVIILLSAQGAPYAAEPSVEGQGQRISAIELKNLIDKGETVLIVDVRTLQEFQANHITGALSVPLHQVEAKLAGLSPDTKIAFY